MAPVREPSLPSVPYEPLPPQNVVVLVPYPRRRGHRLLIRCLYGAAALLFLALAIFFLYPSDPYVQVARVRLNHIQVDSSPNLTLDLSFSLTIRIRNKDFFSLYYNSLLVSVGYRGRELGIVTSEGEKIRARGSSYVNATLDLDGLEVVHDAVYLIRDLAKGVIPFDTDTQVNGKLGLFFVSIPIEILCGARRRIGQHSPRGAKPTITEGRKQSTGTPSKQPIRDPGADSHRWTRNHLHIHGHIMEQQGNRTRRSGPQRKHRIHQWLARRDHDEQPPWEIRCQVEEARRLLETFDFWNCAWIPAWWCLQRKDPSCLVGEHTHRPLPAAARLTPEAALAMFSDICWPKRRLRGLDVCETDLLTVMDGTP